jgi:PhnB protein
MANTGIKKLDENDHIQTSIAPWLSVHNGAAAVDFYKSAFGAIEVYRLEPPGGGIVARLSVNDAEFWLSGESPDNGNAIPEFRDEVPVRMIITVPDPDAVFDRALKAGAREIFAVGEDHGWRLGRLVDPFGHHWEIGRPVNL